MRGVTTLSGVAGAGVGSSVSVNLVFAVGFVVVVALTALAARPNLGTDTNTLANLSEGDLGSDAENLADDLVSNSQRIGAVTPVAANSVPVTGTNTTALDLDVDIIVAKGAGLPLALGELGPVRSAGRLETLKLIGN